MAKKVWKSKIGKNYVDRLDEVAITVGRDSFTRRELVKLADTANFIAAQNLNQALKRFKGKSVRELSRRIDFDTLLDIDNIRDTAMNVWCSMLDAKGVDVLAWLDFRLPKPKEKTRKKRRVLLGGQKDNLVKFPKSA